HVEGDPLIIAAEPFFPHDVVVYEVVPPVLQEGRAEYQRLLLRVAECEARREWPGRAPEGPVQLELPEWAYRIDDGLDYLGLEEEG
ncbi:MAG TPA: hypothetical protein VMR48_02500, partial [Gaiellaceae bacterium]|nr:hypothetical protein [Gaiellaceae bacterium]